MGRAGRVKTEVGEVILPFSTNYKLSTACFVFPTNFSIFEAEKFE